MCADPDSGEVLLVLRRLIGVPGEARRLRHGDCRRDAETDSEASLRSQMNGKWFVKNPQIQP
jgi:hypothetical protein